MTVSEEPQSTQNVSAEGGFAYGVVGGDMHVHQDRGPVYFLDAVPAAEQVPDEDLVAQPSQFLLARRRTVEFVGRKAEMETLAEWRDSENRLSVLWLYGPGGLGKSRLADEFARASRASGWKTLTAVHGRGNALASGRGVDLTPGEAAGVLLLVDYADRWPVSDLVWLLNNRVLHAEVPCRVVLVARTRMAFNALLKPLDDLGASAVALELSLLPGEGDGIDRADMFVRARDRFARAYSLADSDAIGPPPGLSDEPEYGLILALHMAALVAVDARHRGLEPPTDLRAMSAYLLDRERNHWTKLYENRLDGLEFATPPAVMSRLVFTAALCGAHDFSAAKALLVGLDLPVHPDTALDDHSRCYPSLDGQVVLEPLYPDRLAEDFIALCLPGRTQPGQAAEPWASGLLEILVRPQEGSAPGYIGRTITVLAATATRWEHVMSPLGAILAEAPGLATAAGGSALLALAELDLAPGLLAGIAKTFPRNRHIDLDVGMAAITARVVAAFVRQSDDPVLLYDAYTDLDRRLGNAGDYSGALEATEAAIAIARPLADDSPQWRYRLADRLHSLSGLQYHLDYEQALASAREAIGHYRTIHAAYPSDDGVGLALALALTGLASIRDSIQRPNDTEAADLARQSVSILEDLVKRSPGQYEPHLATALTGLGRRITPQWIVEDESTDEAYNVLTRAVEINRYLAGRAPEVYEPSLAASLAAVAEYFWAMQRRTPIYPWALEASSRYRVLAAKNPASFSAPLTEALRYLTYACGSTLRFQAAATAAQEAFRIRDSAPSQPSNLDNAIAWIPLLDMAELSQAAKGILRIIDTQPGTPGWVPDPGADSYFTADDPVTVLALNTDITEKRSSGESLPLATALIRFADWLSDKAFAAAALTPAHEALDLQLTWANSYPDADLDLYHTYHLVVWGLVARGDRPSALQAVQRALAVNPADPEGLARITRVLEHTIAEDTRLEGSP